MLCIRHNEIPLPSNFVHLIIPVAFCTLLSKCNKNLDYKRATIILRKVESVLTNAELHAVYFDLI